MELKIDKDANKAPLELALDYYQRSINRILGLEPRSKLSRIKIRLPLSSENKACLLRYYAFLKSGNTKAKSIRCFDTKLKILSRFLGTVNKDAKNIAREDIELFLAKTHVKSSTRETYKLQIKYFFQWLFGCPEGEYPPNVDWIKIQRNPIANAEEYSVLTKDEIKQLIANASIVRDKCIISMLADGGLRISELTNIKIKDCKFDDRLNICRIEVFGKTGKRKVTFVESVPILKEWLNQHPFKDHQDHALFICTAKKFGRPLASSGAYKVVLQVVQRTGIKKRITPHVFRHSKLSYLAMNGMNEFELRVFAGWSKSSRMSEVYVHIGEKETEKKLLEINGISDSEEKDNSDREKLKPIKCFRCEHINDVGNKFCSKCGCILNPDEIPLIEKAQDSFTSMLAGNQHLQEEFIEDLKKKIMAELMAKIK